MKWLQDRPWIWVIVTFIVVILMWVIAARVAKEADIRAVPLEGH